MRQRERNTDESRLREAEEGRDNVKMTI